MLDELFELSGRVHLVGAGNGGDKDSDEVVAVGICGSSELAELAGVWG